MTQKMQEINCKDCYMEMMFDSERLCMVCENCQGTYLLLTPVCKIIKIGLELEGGWYNIPYGSDEENPLHAYTWHNDSSVEGLDMGCCGDCDYCNNGESEDCREGNGSAGEIVSYPMRIDDINTKTVYGHEPLWHSWVKRFYPEEHNHKCGGHFHVSFDNIQAFEFLCTEHFFNHFQSELRRWGVRANIKNSNFWERLNGDNHMCKTTFRGTEQLYVSSGENYPDCRYSILNFQYNKHGTLEFRILPIFKSPALQIRATEVCMEITQKYLDRMANRPISIEDHTVTPEISFTGRITTTMVQEYINNEPADEVPLEEITFGIPDTETGVSVIDTNDSYEAVASIPRPLETDLQILSQDREIDENTDESMGYVVRYRYRFDSTLLSGIIFNELTESVMTNEIRVRRFEEHFASYGLNMARQMFHYALSASRAEIESLYSNLMENN